MGSSDTVNFTDMPDVEEKDFISALIAATKEIQNAGPVPSAFIIVRMSICITKMRREIKKLKMQNLEHSNN